MTVSRRTLLQLAGLAALPRSARGQLPSTAWSLAAHRRQGVTPRLLTPDERATIAAIADAILPRTDTPGALDVGVPDFVELLLAEWAAPNDRDRVRQGLAELDAHARATQGATWAALSETQRMAEIAWAEEPDGGSEAQRAFRRLKGWIVRGWITSERVQRDVLKTRVVPGEYLGCAPVLLSPDEA